MKLDRLKRLYSHQLHHLVFIVLSCVYLASLFHTGTTYKRFEKVLNEDAFGYYSILPAIFKYNDPQFRFLDTSVRRLPAYAHYIPPVVNQASNGKNVIKYYSGVAFLQLPFYLAGDFIAHVEGSSIGYEPVYHFSVLASVICYLFAGVWQCKQLLVKFGLHPMLAVMLPFIMLFGSNLYCYTTYDMAYSHVYSFFALVSFIHFLVRLKHQFSFGNAIGCGLFYGLVLFIRPLNGISLLFVPIIFGGRQILIFFRKENLTKTLLIMLSSAVVLSIQSLLWFWQTGLFYVYPYGYEKLDLLNPRMTELVFGFDAGWAVYTPLPFLLLCTTIVILIVRKQFARSFFAVLCSLAVVYLLSCWYYLHYGCTVGCRPITEFYGPLIVLFGYSLGGVRLKTPAKSLLLIISSLFICYNQVIHYQFYENIMNWCHMDRDKFSFVFMKTHPAYRFATSEPWDFSEAGPIAVTSPVQKLLAINEQKTKDTVTVYLPPFTLSDSSGLLSISFSCKMKREINESFLIVLLTDGDEYIDRKHMLLRKQVNKVDEYRDMQFEMLLTKPVQKGKLHISLESVDGDAETICEFQDIAIRRIRMGS